VMVRKCSSFKWCCRAEHCSDSRQTLTADSQATIQLMRKRVAAASQSHLGSNSAQQAHCGGQAGT
jgi:hypothetical protein